MVTWSRMLLGFWQIHSSSWQSSWFSQSLRRRFHLDLAQPAWVGDIRLEDIGVATSFHGIIGAACLSAMNTLYLGQSLRLELNPQLLPASINRHSHLVIAPLPVSCNDSCPCFPWLAVSQIEVSTGTFCTNWTEILILSLCTPSNPKQCSRIKKDNSVLDVRPWVTCLPVMWSHLCPPSNHSVQKACACVCVCVCVRVSGCQSFSATGGILQSTRTSQFDLIPFDSLSLRKAARVLAKHTIQPSQIESQNRNRHLTSAE